MSYKCFILNATSMPQTHVPPPPFFLFTRERTCLRLLYIVKIMGMRCPTSTEKSKSSEFCKKRGSISKRSSSFATLATPISFTCIGARVATGVRMRSAIKGLPFAASVETATCAATSSLWGLERRSCSTAAKTSAISPRSSSLCSTARKKQNLQS